MWLFISTYNIYFINFLLLVFVCLYLHVFTFKFYKYLIKDISNIEISNLEVK